MLTTCFDNRLNFALRSAQLTNLLFLARSMSVNLGSPGIPSCPSVNRAEAQWGELENVRAYVGTYYLNAMYVFSRH